MKKVFIVSAKRSPIGKFGGNLASLSAANLAAQVIRNILQETGVAPEKLDEVVVGNVLMAGQKQGVARQASVAAGIPAEVPAYGVNMICGSGMKSIHLAFNAIRSGQAKMILAGGTESMSNAGFVLPSDLRTGFKMGDLKAVDHMVCDGLTDGFQGYHMGITAENIAEKYSITREEQDQFSFRSQQRAIDAIDEGLFKNEIVPIEYTVKKETKICDTDEFPNRNTSLEKLAALRPAFKKEGSVTAGNASGINDGASFVLLADEDTVAQMKWTPLAEIVAIGQGGVPPEIMGMGPVPAIAKALDMAQMKLSDMQVLELNEAFAAQALGVMKQLATDHQVEKTWFDKCCNLQGGAIALGHPIGASGNRIVVSLIHQMMAAKQQYGLAALCIGGGMGTAVILKRN